MYLTSLPILALGSLGVSVARSIPELIIFRFIQAFGSGAGVSVGAGVIADIYRLEERGKAMGIFFGARTHLFLALHDIYSLDQACLLGPAIAPPEGRDTLQ